LTQIKIQLAKPGGGFHESSNGIDSEVAKEWVKAGRCRYTLEPVPDPIVFPDTDDDNPASEPDAADVEEEGLGDLSQSSVASLLEMADGLGIPGRSKMKKSDLINAINSALESD
jgi:hypothetical protein